ncbi:MAG TPA: Gfo/Idh/MocA family oxidoreductase [Streptosporangiaceae bacterium]|jgi:myo-inositol 2-dehydrogenase/D-chiro-inositol 1-dehydrogenase
MRIGLIGAGRIGAFHAATLRGLPGVDSVVISDADLARAQDVARRLGTETADSAQDLLAAGVDALVIATTTGTHPELIRLGVEKGLPVFCEKPVAPDIDGTLEVIKQVSGGTSAVQIGFQRRFDAGFRAARETARDGTLGWLHTIRSTTLDAAPPPADYIPGSGGIFRDCAVHDFDAIRWVSGREVTSAYAVGANRGEEFFKAAGDVDTASAMLTMDDGTIALVSCTRYNAGGYDVRLELLGEKGSVCAGLDDRMPLRSADPGVTFPGGPAYRQFMERFHDAYVAELTAFTDVVAGRVPSPCTPQDALEAFYVAQACELSRHRGEPVQIREVRR